MVRVTLRYRDANPASGRHATKLGPPTGNGVMQPTGGRALRKPYLKQLLLRPGEHWALFLARVAVFWGTAWARLSIARRLFVFLEVCVNIHSVASTMATPSYQRTTSSNSNPVQTIEHVATEVAGVAATVAPVVGLVGGLINIFA